MPRGESEGRGRPDPHPGSERTDLMTVDLTKAAAAVSFDADLSYKPMLDNLQANILRPHGRDHVRHLFLKFIAPKAAVRSWIKNRVSPAVTSASDLREQSKKRAEAK